MKTDSDVANGDSDWIEEIVHTQQVLERLPPSLVRYRLGKVGIDTNEIHSFLQRRLDEERNEWEARKNLAQVDPHVERLLRQALGDRTKDPVRRGIGFKRDGSEWLLRLTYEGMASLMGPQFQFLGLTPGDGTRSVHDASPRSPRTELQEEGAELIVTRASLKDDKTLVLTVEWLIAVPTDPPEIKILLRGQPHRVGGLWRGWDPTLSEQFLAIINCPVSEDELKQAESMIEIRQRDAELEIDLMPCVDAQT